MKRLDPERLAFEWGQAFGRSPDGVALAPGRVNLIGEHTDYNGGFVLPMAIERHVGVAFGARGDRTLRARALAFAESRDAEIDRLRPGMGGWFGYVAGVAWALEASGYRVRGADLLIDADLPRDAGLSSSAALELASARALSAASEIDWEPVEMAQLCRKGENDFVGVACGIMDQMASAACEEGAALLLDCRSLEGSAVELPAGFTVVVMDSGVRRSLAGGEYNRRRQSCEAAVAALREDFPEVGSLRDVSAERLATVRERLDETVYRRAQHVVLESYRPVDLAAAFAAGDVARAGHLINESHDGLRDLFEVSCRELDMLVDLARDRRECLGARLTGAGFGGCAIALVEAGSAATFIDAVQDRYRKSVRAGQDFFVSRPVGGARLVP